MLCRCSGSMYENRKITREKNAPHHSPHFLPSAELEGAAFESAGEAAVEGGDVGFSDSKLASSLEEDIS
jgi:hypothetical protein